MTLPFFQDGRQRPKFARILKTSVGAILLQIPSNLGCFDPTIYSGHRPGSWDMVQFC